MNKKQWIGIGIFVALIAVVIGIKVFMNNDDTVDFEEAVRLVRRHGYIVD